MFNMAVLADNEVIIMSVTKLTVDGATIFSLSTRNAYQLNWDVTYPIDLTRSHKLVYFTLTSTIEQLYITRPVVMDPTASSDSQQKIQLVNIQPGYCEKSWERTQLDASGNNFQGAGLTAIKTYYDGSTPHVFASGWMMENSGDLQMVIWELNSSVSDTCATSSDFLYSYAVQSIVGNRGPGASC
jgi:hypothetical protein